MGKQVKRSGRKQSPKDETKAGRFNRIVKSRVDKAIKAIRVIGYCGGSTYEYSPHQVEQILTALTKATIDLQAKFTPSDKKESSFNFDSG